MEWLAAAVTAFLVVAPVELPDKTFVATLVLSTRYRPLPVWLGVVAAFAVQCLLAVLAGSLLAQLPDRLVRGIAATLFLVGAVILARGARTADAAEAEQEHEYAEKVKGSKHGWRAAAASLVVLFTAEWGDLSQVLTANLVATGAPPTGVFAGAWAALATVSGAAVLLGRWLLRRVRLSLVRYLAAGVCLVLAVATLIDIFRGV